MEDFSPRAVRVLSEADFVAAEDTRVTAKLLNHFGIKTETVSYFEHNKWEKGKIILDRLLAGKTAALVTDAGMPAVSDPGEDLVRLCHENGVAVESVPGPSAFVTALSISGMPSVRFCFEGFLPVEKKPRKERLAELAGEKRTLIFYEAPHKLVATLRDLSEALGDRPVAVVKELTKLHETVLRTTLFAARDHFEANAPRGEYVLIVAGADGAEKAWSLDDAAALARKLLGQGMSPTAAAKEAASASGCKKSDIYKAILES